MNTYCISRTTYNTYASIKNTETGEFVSLLKGYDTLPAYDISTWKNPKEMRRMREQLGIEDQGHCFVSYRGNAQLPHEADEIKAAMEEAGFPNVHMVADTDIVMAHYQQQDRAMDAVDTEKGVIVTGIFNETLYATLCRRGLHQTASTFLCHNEDDSFYDIPESFFKTIRSDWGEVSAVMYYGYYGLCNEMRDYLDACFPEAEIYSSWAEIYPYCKQNLQHALEGMLPRLDRCKDIIHAWNRCIDTSKSPGDEPDHGLISLLDDSFRKHVLPEIKDLSDVGYYVYDVLAAWACNEPVCSDASGEKHRIHKDALIPEMKKALHAGLHRNKENFLNHRLRCTAGYILNDIRDSLGIADLSLTADEIYLKLPEILEPIYGAETEKLLTEKLQGWWGTRFILLEEGFFVNRRKQIKEMQGNLKSTRMECRKSVLRVLLDEVIHIKQLRARFIRTILLALGENLRYDLMGCFSPITLEFAGIPRLEESTPDEGVLNSFCRGGLKSDLNWDDEEDTFSPVRTSALRIQNSCASSGSEPVGDNYFEDCNGTVTYWWEYID